MNVGTGYEAAAVHRFISGKICFEFLLQCLYSVGKKVHQYAIVVPQKVANILRPWYSVRINRRVGGLLK
jgi:hypothetical protein